VGTRLSDIYNGPVEEEEWDIRVHQEQLMEHLGMLNTRLDSSLHNMSSHLNAPNIISYMYDSKILYTSGFAPWMAQGVWKSGGKTPNGIPTHILRERGGWAGRCAALLTLLYIYIYHFCSKY